MAYSCFLCALSFANAAKERAKEKRWRLAKKCLNSPSRRGAEKTPRPDQDKYCRDSSDSFPRSSRRSLEFRAAFFPHAAGEPLFFSVGGEASRMHLVLSGAYSAAEPTDLKKFRGLLGGFCVAFGGTCGVYCSTRGMESLNQALAFAIACLAMTDPSGSVAQVERGVPFIVNFDPKTYGGHFQNWDVTQSSRGILYVANGYGVLEHDGVSWSLLSLPNENIVRSVAITGGRMYVGSQNELGYFEYDDRGHPTYQSLVPLVPEAHRNFADVWRVVAMDSTVYFSTYDYLFAWDGQRMRTWTSRSFFYLPFRVGRRLLAYEARRGIVEQVGDSIRLISGGDFFARRVVYDVQDVGGDRLLVSTGYDGLYFLQDGRVAPAPEVTNRFFKDASPSCGAALSDGSFAIGTRRGGIAIVDSTGTLRSVLDQSNGLLSQTVRALFSDAEGSLWAAYENGVSRIEFPSPFTSFGRQTGLDGSVYEVARDRGRIVASTSSGVFVLRTHPYRVAQFERVEGLSSQCWGLLAGGSSLLASSNIGTFEIGERTARRVNDYAPWTFHRMRDDPSRILVGLGDGLGVLTEEGRGWIDEGRVEGVDESIEWITETPQGVLWLGTSYQGVLRVEDTSAAKTLRRPLVRRVTTDHGLPTMLNNRPFWTSIGLLIGTERGLFRVDSTERRIVPDTLLPVSRRYFGKQITRLCEDRRGRLVAVVGRMNEARVVVMDPASSDLTELVRLGAFRVESLASDGDGVWLGGADGLIQYRENIVHPASSPASTLIRRVAILHDTVLIAGSPLSSMAYPQLTTSFFEHVLRFEYALPSFVDPSRNEYQYQLVGFDPDWSPWSPETRNDYTNLQEGSYVFRVRGRDVWGRIGSPAEFSFRILPPTYRTWWAYLLYAAVFVSLSGISLRFFIRRAQHRAVAERLLIEQAKKEAESDVRRRVAEDFHDELGNKITRISLYGAILKNQFRTDATLPREYLDKITENAHALYNETRDFIWQLNPEKNSLYDVCVHLKRFCDELYDGTGIHFEMTGGQTDWSRVKLSMNRMRHLVRIFKEAAHNALKHARCKNVVLNFVKNEQTIRVQLSDDGMGFDAQGTPDGNGLHNMSARAGRMEARLFMTSEPHRGTEVTLEFENDAEHLNGGRR